IADGYAHPFGSVLCFQAEPGSEYRETVSSHHRLTVDIRPAQHGKLFSVAEQHQSLSLSGTVEREDTRGCFSHHTFQRVRPEGTTAGLYRERRTSGYIGAL